MQIVKSAIVALGAAAGFAITAQAQSVSTLPPSAAAPPQSAYTQPYGSTQSYFPKPGGAEALRQGSSNQAATATDNANTAPYSAKNFAPRAN